MPCSSLQKVSNCSKYPGHEDFIPLTEFSPQHLRAVRQKSKLYDLIKCQGALTVKIASRRKRSANHIRKKIKVIQRSTGFVIWVNKRTAGIGQSCHCDECILNHQDIKHGEWYELIIVTNSSTISNEYVAETVEVEFSLNEEQRKTLTLKGKCKYVGLNEDICQLHFITNDIELGSKLHAHFVQFENLLSNAFSLVSKDSEFIFSFTVSHPHGCDKHVSFSLEKDFFHSFGGSGIRMMEKNKGRVLWPSNWNHAKVYYNVPTCAGSSGAIVITLTRNKGIIISLHYSGSKRYSWTKEKNVRHFSEFLKEDEEPDRLEDFGPMIQFPSSSDIKENEHDRGIEQSSEVNPMSKPEHVTVLKPRDVRHQLVPQRIIPRRISPCPVTDDKMKVSPQKHEIVDSNLPIIESKEKILQLDQESEITKMEPSASKDAQFGSILTASHCNQEFDSPESKPHYNNIERVNSVSSQSYKELKTSESKASPSSNEGIASTVSQGYQEAKIPVSKPSPDDNNTIISPTCQVHQELRTSEPSPSPNSNERMVSSTPPSYQEAKIPESKPSPDDNDTTVSPTYQVHQGLTTPNSNSLESIVSPTSQSCDKSKISGSNPSSIINERSISPKTQCHQELKTSNSNPSLSNDDKIVVPQFQKAQEPNTTESNPSPNNNDRIVSPPSQGSQEPNSTESNPSSNNNGKIINGDRIVSPPSQGSKELHTTKSNPSPKNNDRIVSSPSQVSKEPHIRESNPSPNNDDRIVSATSQGSKEHHTTESNPSPYNDDRIVSATSQGYIESKTSESNNSEGKVLSTSHAMCKPKHTKPESNFSSTEKSISSLKGIFDVKNQGLAESEIFYGPEVHLPLSYVQCEKNQGHEKFFHLGELKLEHLPEKLREEHILENIHHAASLTVKVKTGYVSRKRPEAHPHTGDPYLFFEKKGLKFLRVGTGFVINVQHEKLKYGQTCQCMECESSESARHECYRIVVMTATHNVFDQAEANRTEIEFSYYQTDKEVTTKLLKGKCKHCVINEDACWLEFRAHDEILMSKLCDHLEQFQKGILNLSKNKVHDKFVTIVSYPHGSTKQHVSFGNILSKTDILSLKVKEEDSDSLGSSEIKSGQDTKSPAFQFYHPFDKIAIWPGDLFKPIVCQQIEKVCYTTPTCRGSSGAVICIHKPGIGNVIYTHWGCGDEEGNYNRSGGGTVFYLNDNQIFPS